ncbi:diguanylate cyclase/phosphodiesterase (GGDEF & EAL domains) with PAS/PAC sensor(s) [Microcystis aeruginosa NIES-98]|nr:diguanylate cyclase/phosphodiesterase (GGDEF & EAL domains) with PAS/PAC sensor(s) [Microcystis aeruginosa NIES-98]
MRSIARRFQSLVGFKINWNPRSWPVRSIARRFQSLVGFKINWNKIMQNNQHS